MMQKAVMITITITITMVMVAMTTMIVMLMFMELLATWMHMGLIADGEVDTPSSLPPLGSNCRLAAELNVRSCPWVFPFDAIDTWDC